MPDIFDQIFRSSIGFDPLRTFVSTIDISNYPPYNIEKDFNKPIYTLTMAVAGFTRDSLDIYIEDGHLHINGKLDDNPETGTDFLYRGLSLRSFKRTFQLGKNVEVVSVNLKDGLLTIVLEENIPEVSRRKFDIK
jgi:molecular chaperone IbpA